VTDELQRRLRALEAPGEEEAGERAWPVVRAAFDQREPVARPRHRLRPVLVLAAAALAVAAAAFTSPVRAVLDEVREAIGVEQAQPALFSLPAAGRLLVESDAGVWVVRRDGSKRLLAGYREASWSPHGAFLVATGQNTLDALKTDGQVRWTLAKPNVTLARWGGTRTDTRIVYAMDAPGVVPALHVVAGDGAPDRWLAKGFVPIAPAWRPGSAHVVAVAHVDGHVRLWGADDRALVGVSPPGERPIQLEWTSDGSRLLVLGRRSLRVLDVRGRPIRRRAMPRGAEAVAMALAPRGTAVALLLRRARRSEVVVVDRGRVRRVFGGAGRFTDVVWSPNGRWLLVAWQDADQWLFIRSSRVREIGAVKNISRQFESERFPKIAGWCCR
jgi:hypothetical protein